MFLHTWHDFPAQADEADLLERWTPIRDVPRRSCRRNWRPCGLPAESVRRCRPKSNPAARRLETYAICCAARRRSAFRAHHLAGANRRKPPKTKIDRSPPAPHQKCERCWHYRADVDAHADHPGLCGRCVCNLLRRRRSAHACLTRPAVIEREAIRPNRRCGIAMEGLPQKHEPVGGAPSPRFSHRRNLHGFGPGAGLPHHRVSHPLRDRRSKQ